MRADLIPWREMAAWRERKNNNKKIEEKVEEEEEKDGRKKLGWRVK